MKLTPSIIGVIICVGASFIATAARLLDTGGIALTLQCHLKDARECASFRSCRHISDKQRSR